MNYEIIKPMKLYPIFTGISIISGTPFLFLQEGQVLVLGDLHLGHESGLFIDHDNNKISKSVVNLVELLTNVILKFKVKKVIVNGDIKHHTNDIKIQELVELKYFCEGILKNNISLIMIKGNHDKFLEFMLPHIDESKFDLITKIQLDDILIMHGDQILTSEEVSKSKIVLLSHEHPAFSFVGMNRAKIKLAAFVFVETTLKPVIILPTSNSISSGTNFPVKNRDQFLSPFLRQHALPKTIEIFPFDPEFGLLELPPVNRWFRD